MLIDDMKTIMCAVRTKSPLIHAITNPISINQSANAVLAAGARPIMAEHPKEVRAITKTAKALLLNLGNMTQPRMKAMKIAAKTAKENHIPVVLDLVGITCSDLRKKFANRLIKLSSPTVIKGNYSEIYALFQKTYYCSGVDAEKSLPAKDLDKVAANLAKRLNCVVLASGKTDILADQNQIIHMDNGVPQLACITGTGCMLGVLTACYLSVLPNIKAAATACAVLGISGQLAETFKGNGSFAVNLMNLLSTLSSNDIEKHLKMEVQTLESL